MYVMYVQLIFAQFSFIDPLKRKFVSFTLYNTQELKIQTNNHMYT